MTSGHSRVWRERENDDSSTKNLVIHKILNVIHGKPVFINAIINFSFVPALVDLGCTIYAVFSENIVKRLNLSRIDVPPKQLRLAKDSPDDSKIIVKEICWADIDLDGRKSSICGYVINGLAHDLILGEPWLRLNDVIYRARERSLYFEKESCFIQTHSSATPVVNISMIKHTEFSACLKEHNRYEQNKINENEIRIFAASLYDINKMLSPKKKLSQQEMKGILPPQLHMYLSVFEADNNDSSDLPPHRPGVDLAINIEKDDQGRTKDLPKGPLYGMSRDELLCLRKEILELLDRNWIRASSSPGGAPVLFVKKPGGGLRFCVDYRALNSITIKDRYPLPLIKETFRCLSKARWLTKIDVSAAFHRIRIKEGDEWKTAFQTRLGLFEWLVMPFGLTGAPAAWQRWINDLLRDFLDDFCTAYLDDVLIWSDGDQDDHFSKVSKVLERLSNAKLKLDLKKCNFAVSEVKYLGFIVKAGQGISVDPEKKIAIEKWEYPHTQTGVRSFLGFANFYRDFISDFAEISAPLQRYTRKAFAGKKKIVLDVEARQAFDKLKLHFTTAPILALFDPDRPTVLETDCSGWAMGACLSQQDKNGKLRPIGYFSKQLSPAECNYDIHDKELLAIVRAVEFWRAELMCLQDPIDILTDHRNLQYFMIKRTLTERQIRWKSILDSLPGIKLRYRPGKEASRPDALSRLEQDIPKDPNDPRLKFRDVQLLKKKWIENPHLNTFTIENVIEPNTMPFQEEDLCILWKEGLKIDGTYRDIKKALVDKQRSFPPSVSIKISIAECSLDHMGHVRWRDRLLIPDYEPLQTAIIHKSHDSVVTGHPGREATLHILSRDFYWPKISNMVRRFVRNCDTCNRTHVWRDKKRGFLKPLPTPDRFFQELSIDFMTDLPAADGQPQNLMVITDRLSKNIILEAMTTMDAEACAQKFLQCFYRFHGFPRAITSDRGGNWISDFWKRLCELVGIQQRLSTAFHPQTDGATERANQEIQAYLRAFVTYAQTDWSSLLPVAQLALNNRDSSLGYSPFFLTHGYHIPPIQVVTTNDKNAQILASSSKEAKKAETLVKKLEEGQSMAQVAMAWRQQLMEDKSNKNRQQQEIFKIGDRVWLNLKNITTPRPSKKFAWLHSKYKITKIISPHVVELDIPIGIHPRFHVDLLKRAANDPLPSQKQEDYQPDAIDPKIPRHEQEFEIDRILRATTRGRGRGIQRLVLVKWKGQAEPTWEPRSSLQETEALDKFEELYGTSDDVGENIGMQTGRFLRSMKKKKKK